jgi:hypothetical protein
MTILVCIFGVIWYVFFLGLVCKSGMPALQPISRSFFPLACCKFQC